MLAVAMLLAAISIFGTLSVSKANAASSWKDYFSQNESNAIKSMVGSYIKDQLSSASGDWKGLISGKAINPSSLSASKLKDGSINADKVDGTITKRVIFTGTAPTNANQADSSSANPDNPPYTDYFKKIVTDKIDTTKNPEVSLYVKVTPGTYHDFDGFNSTISQHSIWKTDDNMFFEDGIIWLKYGYSDNDGWAQNFGDYKIVVNY